MERIKRDLFLIVSLLLVINGCSSKPSDMILGKWDDNGSTMEFFKDGTCILNTKSGIKDFSMKYIILDDMRIKLDATGPLGGTTTVIFKIWKITNDELGLEDNDGKRSIAKKIKT